MKNTITILQTGILIVLFASLFSCELEEYNPSGSTADAIWSTPEGFQTLINAAYGNQRTFYGKEDGIILGEAGTDLWFKAKKGWSYRELFRYEDFMGSTAGSNRNYWRDLWPAVNYCNSGINRIDNANYPSESEKNAKLGELRFLRAFYYWHIVETWGGVSLRTTETTTADLNAYRSPVEDFYELMIDDLNFAVEYLPVDQGEEYSRASRKSAMGFLARVYLTRAYYSLDKNNKTEADSYFTLAKQLAHATIDSAALWGVSLFPDYADLWQNDINNKRCAEALYVVSNSIDPSLNYDGNGNRLHEWFLASYSNKPGLGLSIEYGYDKYGYFMPTQFLVDLFDEDVDARYYASFQEVWYCNDEEAIPKWLPTELISQFADHASNGSWAVDDNGDTIRMADPKFAIGDTAMVITKHVFPDKHKKIYLVVDRDSLYYNDTIATIADVYPSMIKHLDPFRTVVDAQPGYLDIIVMRLAEMYMIAAEAEFQLGELSLAADDINVIRNRASITHSGDMNITAGEVTLDFILDERAREFAGEHLRWFDLKRTRTLVQRIEAYNKDIHMPDNLKAKGNGMFENALLRPIPQTELDALLNGDEFGQNPGYN